MTRKRIKKLEKSGKKERIKYRKVYHETSIMYQGVHQDERD